MFEALVVIVIVKDLDCSLNKVSKLNGNGILVLIIDWTLIELNQIILLYVQKVHTDAERSEAKEIKECSHIK